MRMEPHHKRMLKTQNWVGSWWIIFTILCFLDVWMPLIVQVLQNSKVFGITQVQR